MSPCHAQAQPAEAAAAALEPLGLLGRAAPEVRPATGHHQDWAWPLDWCRWTATGQERQALHR